MESVEDGNNTGVTVCVENGDKQFACRTRRITTGDIQFPTINISIWNGQNCLEYPNSLWGQDTYSGKMKTSVSHRQMRLKQFRAGHTTSCRNVVDERKLRVACSQNDHITVMELLDGGADPSAADEKKRTPLHLAASQGFEQIVKLLLDKGADPNKKDFIGNTPLHLAASTCQIPVVTLLLKAGTDIKSVDKFGRTPLQLAQVRLKMLAENRSNTSHKLRAEILEISDMMKTYLNLSGNISEADQLHELCQQLEKTSTREEIDAVGSMMSEFASLTIQKQVNR